MRIQNNIMALNTHRQLAVNNLNQSKSTEKLSSGYRINRAADDASGLSISEKMRAQIRGLNQASANAQDGISLIQAAEGALQETHSILQRMRELAVKAANDTNETLDRDAIAAEISQLTSEVDRIANTTEFNKKTLLDGSLSSNLSGRVNSGGGISGVTIDPTSAIDEGEYTITTTAGTKEALSYEVSAAAKQNDTIKFTLSDGRERTLVFNTDESDEDSTAATIQAFLAKEVGDKFDVTVTGAKVALTAKEVGAMPEAFAVAKTGTVAGTAATGTAGANATATATGGTALTFTTTDGKHFSDTTNGVSFIIDDPSVVNTAVVTVGKGAPLTLQVGANSGSSQTISIGIDSLSATSLGLAALDVSNHTKSQSAIDSIEAAINKVSTQRGNLGAVQNRLEHTVANLDTVSENLTSAESRIRDVDMAKEMMNFTKNNILQQAATAMLAQANQAPQTVLQLLR